MPAQPTSVERLARWAALVSIHPESGHFDARRFVQDMVNRNILFTLHMVRFCPAEMRCRAAVVHRPPVSAACAIMRLSCPWRKLAVR